MLAAWLVFRVAWRTGPLALIFTFGEVISTVLRFLQPAMVGLIIDGLVGQSSERLIWGTTLLVVSLAFGGALEALAVGYRVKLIQDVGHAFDKEVMYALSQISELDRLEQQRLATAVAKVRDRADAMGFCFNGLMSVVIQAAAPITSICVAVAIDPRLAVLTLAGIPAILVTRRVTALQQDADEISQPHASRAVAWGQLMSNEDARAERKVFRLWEWYRSNMSAAVGRRDAAFFRPAWVDSVGSFLAELFYLACAAGTLLWVLTTGDGVSAGVVAAALLVSLDLKGAMGALRFALSGFGPTLRAALALRDVRDAAAEAFKEEPRGDDGPGSGTVCRLSGVSYVYPAAKNPALRDVDLLIEPGQVVAVVGANGAGKSTLVELLLRLRRPTAGQVTLPRVKRSVIAQHFARYQFTMAEAVGLDDLSNLGPTGMAKVQASLQHASSRPFWEEHPDGITRQLGSGWPGGTDLSAGQWQAIAAARCFYVEDADLVVLDEPTAALDPEAQETMTARYAVVARQVASRGGVAVLVTHRMSMPMLADRIIVLHDGEVVEAGTHDQLLAINGRYAHAYHAAASGFKEMASEGSAGAPARAGWQGTGRCR
jgi:ATP-binding cassette subfamily B protein